MFYLIIAILLVLYYVFVAPKTVKNTMNMISLVAIVAFLLVLAGMTFIKILQSPPEILVGLGMIVVGYYALRDVMRLSKKSR